MLEQLIEQMWSGAVVNHRMEKLMEHLAERLRHTGGRKQYGYLKAPLKAVVDEIVDELAKEPCVAAAYALWYELREDVLRTYKDDLPPRLPLSQQKAFKRIKNIVIEEAVTLGRASRFSIQMTSKTVSLWRTRKKRRCRRRPSLIMTGMISRSPHRTMSQTKRCLRQPKRR